MGMGKWRSLAWSKKKEKMGREDIYIKKKKKKLEPSENRPAWASGKPGWKFY